jgi:N-methylhydantoinase A/oxoprolinase/acetone carboxylase beta subunit
MNAYTQPITAPYLAALAEELARRGFPNRPLIMLSNGGIVGTGTAGRFPVRMIESGPAAGALAAVHFAGLFQTDRLLSFDMGGATAKACVIQDRRPLVAGSFEVDRRYRFKPGSGFPIVIPATDMIEIGAGGGSIAAVDALGLLKVGPRSAGSEPGPVHACSVGELPDCATVIFPPLASVLSAFGALVTSVRLDLMRSALGDLAAPDWSEIDALLAAMCAEGSAALAEAGIAPGEAVFAAAADMRYRGQQNEVTTALPEATLHARDAAAMREAFERAYEALYGS